MTRTQVINSYGRTMIRPRRYLEIGVRDGVNFIAIEAEVKHGVDPNVPCSHRMTSDEFFAQSRKVYDLVFIDGLHLYEQALRDIENALRCTHDKSVILVHDCNPPTEFHQRENYVLPDGSMPAWNGTVWKAFVQVRHTRNDLSCFVIDADWGIGVIERGESNLTFDPRMLNYAYFDAHRKELLDLR